MHASDIRRAIAAATSTVSALGLEADDAVVLHNSNKLALRLLPCDLMARVAPTAEAGADFELGLARRLIDAGSPVAAPDPRVEPRGYQRDGFVITLWTYYPSAPSETIPPAAYADALHRLHLGMSGIDVPTPQVTDRVDSALALVEDPELTPDLVAPDRQLLDQTLQRMRRAITSAPHQQLLHGEPHPGNVLHTDGGLVFIDLETCCRGPVEFDLAHAPDDVAAWYPAVDHDLLRDSRILKLAVISTWRWDRHDQFPNGLQLGREWLAQIRAQLAARSGG